MTAQPAPDEVDGLRWIHEHPEELEAYQGRWVAVRDGKIITSGRTASEVYAVLSQHSIDDALLFRVPVDVYRKSYFIG